MSILTAIYDLCFQHQDVNAINSFVMTELFYFAEPDIAAEHVRSVM